MLIQNSSSWAVQRSMIIQSPVAEQDLIGRFRNMGACSSRSARKSLYGCMPNQGCRVEIPRIFEFRISESPCLWEVRMEAGLKLATPPPPNNAHSITVPTFKYMEGGQRLVLTEVV